MSSPSNKAANAANAAEAERQSSIKRTQGAVNDTFDSPQRKADIADFVGAMRTYYGDDLSRQKTTNDRELKFAMARGGLTGGKVAIDKQRAFGEDYLRGQLDVERKARGAGADLEAGDQDARARLISLATSGLDVTTGASQAAAAMRSSLESGKSTAMAQGLGDVFGAGSKFYQNSQDAKVRRRADRDTVGLYQPSAATAYNYGGGP